MDTILMELDLTVEEPMGILVSTLTPVFFEFAFAIDEVLVVAVFINEVVGVEETLATHDCYWE